MRCICREGFFARGFFVRTTSPEMPHTLAVSANYFYAAQIYATPAEALTLKSVRLKKPDAVVGGSILIFNLDPSDPQVNPSLGTIMALHGE
jgi:hypothetical protein